MLLRAIKSGALAALTTLLLVVLWLSSRRLHFRGPNFNVVEVSGSLPEWLTIVPLLLFALFFWFFWRRTAR